MRWKRALFALQRNSPVAAFRHREHPDVHRGFLRRARLFSTQLQCCFPDIYIGSFQRPVLRAEISPCCSGLPARPPVLVGVQIICVLLR